MPTKPTKQVRVRIAPSPTGPLHLGTARTALFNWLYASQKGGVFVLRIEDTDLERSDPKYETEIQEGLRWLGIEWDEFYKQSERTDLYTKYLTQLLRTGQAYYCYCAKEELEAERQAQLAKKLPPTYSGKCSMLELAPHGKKPQLIRFKVPKREVEFTDIIRGEVSFDAGLFGDMAIAKDLRTPLYNFAVVVDDATMEISHVIRGEDHIPNTPKQILLQEALGFARPEYAHLPLILNPDKSKLSKRFTETSLLAYRGKYLSEAVINFMAFLGWHPKEEKDVMAREELIKEFDLDRVQKSGAVFNEEKLKWLNAEHMKRSPEKVIEILTPEIQTRYQNVTPEKIRNSVSVVLPRMKTIDDYFENAATFFELPEYEPGLLLWKDMKKADAKKHLAAVKEMLTEEAIMAYANAEGRGEVLWPLRVALSGEKDSPGPFEMLEVLGKDEALRRIDIAIVKL